jgi:hypothetical protein
VVRFDGHDTLSVGISGGAPMELTAWASNDLSMPVHHLNINNNVTLYLTFHNPDACWNLDYTCASPPMVISAKQNPGPMQTVDMSFNDFYLKYQIVP